jgi:N,N'-diacetyllegionaminate synthase
MRTFVIAEAGISHCGKIENAQEAILIAKEAGADACKFQYFDAKKLAEARNKPELADLLKPYEMPKDWLPQLKETCDAAGLEFMATTYYDEAIADVAPLVKRFKIGHGESGSDGFVHEHLKYGKEIVMSFPTNRIRTHSLIKRLLVATSYPTKLEDLRWKEARLDVYDGFSDHTRNELTGALAVACGARIIEAHFQPWNVPEHPDTCVSLTPSELWRYVKNIREAELAVYGSSSG